MENEKLLKILKDNSLSLRNTDIKNISKKQLNDILFSLRLQVFNYINSPIILNHFLDDVVKDLEQTWKDGEK